MPAKSGVVVRPRRALAARAESPTLSSVVDVGDERAVDLHHPGREGSADVLAAVPGVVALSLDPWSGLTVVDYERRSAP
jgi:hypothetical protein